MFALNVTLQVAELAVVQPAHDEKLFPLAEEGAVRMIDVPELAVTVKLVVPLVIALLPFSVYPIDTPLAGFVEFIVSVYVVGGGGVVVVPPPLPQDAAARLKYAAEHNVTSLPKRFITVPLMPALLSRSCVPLRTDALSNLSEKSAPSYTRAQ